MKKILGVIFHPTKNNKIKKSLLLLTVAFFVGGFFVVNLANAQVATPQTFYVNSGTGNNGNDCLSPCEPCKTIQGAVDKASDGDTIEVGSGLYEENVSIQKEVKLMKTGDTVSQTSGAGSNEVIVTEINIKNSTENVHIEGMRILKVTADPAGEGTVIKGNEIGYIHFGSETEGLIIEENVFDALLYEGESTAVGALYENSKNSKNNTEGDKVNIFRNNIVKNAEEGIGVVGNPVIENNTFENNTYHIRSYEVSDFGKTDFESILTSNSFDRAVVIRFGDEHLYERTLSAEGNGVDAEEIIYTAIFSSIQDAIDHASHGNIIEVGAGTYEEEVVINKPLTLRGATWNINKNGYNVPENYNWDPTVESIIVHPNSNNGNGYDAIVDIYDIDGVTFEGFVVQEHNAVKNKNTSLVRVRAQTKNISVNIRNNIIGPNTNVEDQDGTNGRMGLYLVNNPYSNQFGIVDGDISGNKIFGAEGNGDNIFIWSSYKAYNANGPASMSGTVIEDNEIYGANRNGIETAGGISDLVIRNNKIYNNKRIGQELTPLLKYGNGIMMIRGSSDKENIDGYGPVDVIIERNEIYGNDGHGIYMGPNNSRITINNNEIINNGWDGIVVDLAGQYWNPTFEPEPEEGANANYAGSENVVAQNNVIYGNGDYGSRVIGVPTNGFKLDAKLNWWGHSDGPVVVQGMAAIDAGIQEDTEEDTREKVSENVLFDPWWVNEEMTRDSNYVEPPTMPGGGPINTTPPTTGGDGTEGDDETEGEVLGEMDSRDYKEQEEEKEEELDKLKNDKERLSGMKNAINTLLGNIDDEEKENLLREVLERLSEMEENLDEEIEEYEKSLEEIIEKRVLTEQKERVEKAEGAINKLLDEGDLTEEQRNTLEDILGRLQELKSGIEGRLNQ
jgi:parallel beta-helix repeat protein